MFIIIWSEAVLKTGVAPSPETSRVLYYDETATCYSY